MDIRRISPVRAFTLLEILVVVTILSLVLALVGPTIGRLPGRLAAERAVAAIGTAMTEASIKARAGGQSMGLTLNTETNAFGLKTADRDRDIIAGLAYRPPNTDETPAEDAARLGIATGKTQFKLPDGVVWDAEVLGRDHSELTYVFHTNGEASGPRLNFTVARRRYEVDVDRLTGRPQITEKE